MVTFSVLREALSILEDLVTERSSDGLGLVICTFVLLEGVSIMEVLFTESSSDSLGLVICSYVLIEVCSELGNLVT